MEVGGMKKVAVINISSFGREFPENMKELEKHFQVEKMLFPQDMKEEELAERLKGFSYVLLGNYPFFGEVFFENNRDVKLIARHGIGYNNVDAASAKRHGVYFTNIPHEVENDAVAEQAVSLVMAVAKNLTTADQKTRRGEWSHNRQELVGFQIRDGVTGVIGLGSIGRRFAEIMKYGFNNQILVYDPFMGDRKIKNAGFTPCTLEEVLEGADVISLHCCLTKETQYLIGAEQLKRMKKTAILINTARGALVDELAVSEALEKGEIFGYGADTSEYEPMDPEHPLLKQKHVVITPHTAIYNRTCMYQMNRKVMEDIFQVEAGKEPSSIVEG
ncbi:3-phosphoglycerate dehydrogenase [bacterium 1XD21-13]|nr:3-phosphoglycerate dehydrogenase [bacterium 1XD21-13]